MNQFRNLCLLLMCNLLLVTSDAYGQKKQKSPVQKTVSVNSFDGTVTTIYRAKGYLSGDVPVIAVIKKKDSTELFSIYLKQYLGSSSNYDFNFEKLEVLKNNDEIYVYPEGRLTLSAFDSKASFSSYGSTYTASTVIMLDKDLFAALRNSKKYRLNGIGAGSQYYKPELFYALLEKLSADYPQYK